MCCTNERNERDLLEEIEHKNTLISKVYSLFELINTDYDNETVYDKILGMAIYSIKTASYGSILVLAEDKIYDFVSLIGFKKEKFLQVRLKPEQTSIYRATKGMMDKSVIINEIFEYNKNCFDNDIANRISNASDINVKTTLSVPIWDDNEPVAILNLDSIEKDAFDESDMKDLEIFAMAVSNLVRLRSLIEIQHYMNNHDELTGIYNRRFLNESVNKLIENEDLFYIVVFDLDNLKEINDNHGHDYGDYYIKKFTDTVYSALSDFEMFFRFAGDEFILLVQSDIDEIMNNIKVAFNILKKDKDIDIRYSSGYACFPDEGHDFDKIFRIADKRMYLEKTEKHRLSSVENKKT